MTDHPEQPIDMVREDFEAWAKKAGWPHYAANCDGGHFCSSASWEPWQAATQRSAERIAELEATLSEIKTLLSRDPCVHANTAIRMIDAAIEAERGVE